MNKASHILILNGPNLNKLGTREPEIYGTTTLDEIKSQCLSYDDKATIDFHQSNDEGSLIDVVQQTKADAIIINAAAYTHTSIALHDALKMFTGRIIEVHLSNPHAREPFRHKSYISPLAEGIICGLGASGYIIAIEHLLK